MNACATKAGDLDVPGTTHFSRALRTRAPSERFQKDLQIALPSREEPRMTLSAQMVKIAQIVELCGAAAVVAGVILSVHHYAIGACFVAGIAALAVGYKLRQS
jgi:hypothetical protein